MMVDNMDTVVEDQLLRKIQETIEKTPLLWHNKMLFNFQNHHKNKSVFVRNFSMLYLKGAGGAVVCLPAYFQPSG